ncbi:MAG: hypothetical protein WCP22_01585 [Chlamydiota bacterium]
MKPREWLAYSAALLVLAAAFSHPLILHFRTGMPYSFIPVEGLEVVHQQPGDSLQLMHRFWLFTQAIRGRIPFFSNPYEFSSPETPPLFNTQGIPISFVFALFAPLGNIVAYNLLVLLSFLASGIAMALLVRGQTGSRGAALCCGALYACLPYRLGHLFGGHPGGFVFCITPLMLVAVDRAWRGERGSFLWGMAAGACILCAASVELHQTLYLGLLLPVYVMMKLIESALRRGAAETVRASRLPLAGLLLVSAAAAGYLLWVKYFFLATSAMGGGRALRTVQGLSPGLRDLFFKSANAEKNVCLGLLPVLLAAWGFAARRIEIRRGLAPRGALARLYFWAGLFGIGYAIALGTALERFVPLYSWLHRTVPFLAYSRTSSRVLNIAVLGFFVLAGFGLRSLFARGRGGAAAALFATALALLDYHPKRFIGVSLMGGQDRVYERVRREGARSRLLELPIWPGDSSWTSIYEYYGTLTGVPIVNGYSPAAQLRYQERVFMPLRTLNIGEIRAGQHALLKAWGVRFVVLHQDAFPRRVSRYPFGFTRENLLRSPYLEFVLRDGPHFLFRVRGEPSGPPQEFALTSPVGAIYPAQKMETDVGVCTHDNAAASGQSLSSTAPGASGVLMRGQPLLYPTGDYTLFVNLKAGIGAGGPRAAIEVFDANGGRSLAARQVSPRDLPGTHEYRMIGLDFRCGEPTVIEFRVSREGGGALWADFAYVLFKAERDPRSAYEAEDLFHIGSAVDDREASGGRAVEVGKDEDVSMPMVSGPARLYGPGRWRVRYRLRAEGAEPGVIARVEAVNAFGGTLAGRDVTRDELAGSAGYRECALELNLEKLAPLSFHVMQFNRARLWLDRIDMERLQD